MKIAIIGSSLSGLVAGKKLALAGHEVTLFEQDKRLGGKLATRTTDKGFFDYGTPFIFPENEQLKQLVQELNDAGIVENWAEDFKFYDGMNLYETDPNIDYNGEHFFASEKGMDSIVNYFKRWVDVKAPIKAGGLTYIGDHRI